MGALILGELSALGRESQYLNNFSVGYLIALKLLCSSSFPTILMACGHMSFWFLWLIWFAAPILAQVNSDTWKKTPWTCFSHQLFPLNVKNVCTYVVIPMPARELHCPLPWEECVACHQYTENTGLLHLWWKCSMRLFVCHFTSAWIWVGLEADDA